MLLSVVCVDCHPKDQPNVIIVICSVIRSLALGQHMGGSMIYVG